MEDPQISKVIQECQEGNLDNFSVLYDAYIKKIYDFIFYKILHKETAEDLTSQTFVKVFNNIGSFDASLGSFSSWLYRIAQNTLIDHVRTRKETSEIDENWDIASTTNVQKEVEAKSHLEGVYKYLETLSTEHRELVVMRVWNEMSFREIAETTGKTEDSVKMMFSRIMKKMRTDLAGLAIFLVVILAAVLYFLTF
jgi:RNA polymerase sigma-70 factor, ECF subfamily